MFIQDIKLHDPLFEGVSFTLDRDEELWRLRGEELNIFKVEGNCEGIEEADKTILVMGFTRLKLDLLALGRLTEHEAPPRIHLRE